MASLRESRCLSILLPDLPSTLVPHDLLHDTRSSSLLLYLHPCLIWVVFLHRRGSGRRVFSQVLLKDFPVMIDYKSHQAGIAVLRRVCDQRKTADHFCFGDVTVSAAGSIFPLRRENPVVIAAIGNGFIARFVGSIALTSCIGDKPPERALRLACFRFPVKTVLLARVAAKPLRVFQQSIAAPVFRREFALGIDVG